MKKVSVNQIEKEIDLGGIKCLITIKEEASGYSFSIKPQDDKELEKMNKLDLNQLKKINQYDNYDLLKLCSENSLTIKANDSKKDSYDFSVLVDKNNEIGPSRDGKILDLYPVHISNLYQISQHLEKSKDPNMLIAMCTGSDKSFIQTLMGMITALTDGVNAVFAVPNQNLVKQLEKDFIRLFGGTFVKENLKNDKLQIVTHKELLTKRWKEFPEIDQEKNPTFIAIDEEHESMKNERDKERVQILAKKLPLCFYLLLPLKRATS